MKVLPIDSLERVFLDVSVVVSQTLSLCDSKPSSPP
jgi:hypothetical protein